MAKIAMIQLQSAPYAGTAYLNGAAISKNHKFVLCLSTDKEAICKFIEIEKPDIIGFSCMSTFIREIIELTKDIKKNFQLPILLGGPHPTLFPEIINEESVDIICRGEGEFALIELLDAIDKKDPYDKIKNLWIKKDGKIHKNALRPLVEPLDEVPLINWSCYENTAVKNFPPVAFLIRGCPYSCSYCFNKTTRDMYAGLGKYVRYFSVQRSIKEIEAGIGFFSKSPVLFTSDSFGIDLKWMEELFTEYAKITKLPFVLLLRPELASEKCIEILAKHNCYSVAIGVESGSERVRKEVLCRNYSNEYLIKVAELLHKNKIKFRTYNMIGLPTETEEEMWETIDLNVKMKTDFPRGAIFTPMPNTPIVDIAKKHDYLDEEFSFDTIPATILSKSILKNVDHDKIENSLYFFQTAIVLPSSRKMIKKLIKIKPNIVYKGWFYFMYAYLHRKSEKRALVPYIKYIIANRKHR